MLNLRNVSYQYDQEASQADLENINIKVSKGECVLLCGRSGSGKTTITKIINSLIPHYYEGGKLEGKVEVGDVQTSDSEIYQVSRFVSSVFQNPKTQFFNVNTTSEILFYLENRGFERSFMEKKLRETAQLFRIEALLNRNIFELSGGEKQIVAIAAAYASGTEMILLDEPSSNLDEKNTRLIGEVLKKIKSSGKTIVLSEHRFYYIKDIIDRVYYIDQGKILEQFSKKDFFSLSDSHRKKMGLRAMDFQELNREMPKTGDRKKLVIENLKHEFKGQNRYLEIKEMPFCFGQIIGIYGQNGIGKSTLIRILMGLQKSRDLQITLDGERISAKKRRQSSYLVMQDVNHQLFTDQVETEVCLGKDNGYSEEDVKKTLEKLNLYDDKERHPMSLSGGQKQRVAVASAILSGAKIICFDEPTSGMDYDHMMKISRLIRETIRQDLLFFIISHDHEFLNHTADEIVDLEKFNQRM